MGYSPESLIMRAEGVYIRQAKSAYSITSIYQLIMNHGSGFILEKYKDALQNWYQN